MKSAPFNERVDIVSEIREAASRSHLGVAWEIQPMPN